MSVDNVSSIYPEFAADSKQYPKAGVCEGCDRKVSKVHGTGFCPECRKDTSAGQEAMKAYYKDIKVKVLDKKRKLGTYDAHVKRDNQIHNKKCS